MASSVRLGLRLRQWRLARGLSLQDVAARLGVSYQLVQKYEKARNGIPLRRLFAIAAVLHVDVAQLTADLFEDTDAPVQGPMLPPWPSTAAPTVSDDGHRLAFAYDRIESPVVRKTILELVRAVAAGSDDAC